MSEKYNYLLGETIEILKENELKSYEITEQLLDGGESKVINRKRNRYKDQESCDEFILQEYTTEEEIISAIRSIVQLNKGYIKQKEVKFDDIRDMDLSIESLEGFRETEQKIIKRRLSQLFEDFNLEKSTDKFLAWRVAICELKTMQLETLLVMNPKLAKEIQAQVQIDLLDKQYQVFCTSLNALKRQRDNTKIKPTDTTGDDYMNTIKSVDEMQAEAEQKKLEVKKKKEEKRKRDK